MEFDREVFDLMPSGSKTFNLIGLKMPSDKDIFFRAKQKETLDKYQAARRFMYELETDDWDHYFHKLEDENGNIYFQNVLKAQWYEAALLFYNAVVDLSWISGDADSFENQSISLDFRVCCKSQRYAPLLHLRAVKMHHAHRALADTDGANQNEQSAKSYAFQNHL